MQPSPIERLRVATLCLIEALRRDEIESIEPLMLERDAAIRELEAIGDSELVQRLLPVEFALREALESEMTQIIETFQRHRAERQAQSTYRELNGPSMDVAA